MGLALLFGLLAIVTATAVECLLWGRPPGVNWPLFVACMAGVTLILMRRDERRMPAWVLGLWGAAATVAGSMALYDAAVVQLAGPWMCAALLTLAMWWSFASGAPLDAFAMPVPLAMLSDLFGSVEQIAPGLQGLRGPALTGDTARRVMLGMLMGVPFVVVFGMLFAYSDDVFRQMLQSGTRTFSGDILLSTVRLVAISVLALGLLRRLVLRDGAVHGPAGRGGSVDALVVSVALGMLNALFLTFLVVQSRYLFGGEAMIALPGITYAEYARHGFWELAAATAIVLLIAIAVHHAVRHSAGNGAAIGLSVLLMVQTFGVAASATKRMALYTDAYGLTVSRFYVVAGIAVICALLTVALIAAVRRTSTTWLLARLTYGTLVFVSLLSLVDVEGTVARTNMAHKHVRDVEYLASLSADVVPVLQQASVGGDAGAERALRIWRDGHPAVLEPWQSFNVSRGRAR